MKTERESFWDNASFAIVTDNTKPAMKWTAEELEKSGKKVHLVDVSSKTGDNTLRNILDLPEGVDSAVIGVTTVNPADLVERLENIGFNKFWIHWRTETPEVLNMAFNSHIQCVIGKCPMMYLGKGINIHSLHRGIAKLTGKY